MHATIKYRLSEAGRKASVLGGGNGKADQELAVPSDSPDFAAVVEQATIEHDGSVVLDLTKSYYGCCEPDRRWFDTVPTLAELLADLPTRRARYQADKAAKTAEIRADTLATLTNRKTRSNNVFLGEGVSYVELCPAWPWPVDKDLLESPEAVAFRAELDATNASALAEAKTELDRIVAEKAKAAKEAADRETTRRTELGLETGDLDLEIEDGALTEIPSCLWQTHKRGKNWMATITINPKSPGGLDRSFAEKAHGESYYIVPSLEVGEAIEFGADYYTSSGRPDRNRWYGYVVRIDPETDATVGRIVVRKSADGKSAVREGAAHVAKQQSVVAE